MSERTFRGVVAVVLVLALFLAVIIAAETLYRPSPPPPSPSLAISPPPSVAPTPEPSPSGTQYAGPVFDAPDIVSVGLIQRGSSSGETLVLALVESQSDAIPNGSGSFQVVISDSAGSPATLVFEGTPTVVAPGSLGSTAALVAPNVLNVEVAAADPLNLETITISGLRIRALPGAATGPISATAEAFSGSLAAGIAEPDLPSPGTVVNPG